MVLVLLHGQPETIAYVEPGDFDAGSNGYWKRAVRARLHDACFLS